MAGTTASDVQDALRPIRSFVGLLDGLSQDQTYADTDAYAINAPYQYQTVGPYGVAIEGAPVTAQPAVSGGITLSGAAIVAMAALAVYLVLR